MGKACHPPNLVAITRARSQVDGTDIFSEAERVKNFNAEQRHYYENTVSKFLGLPSAKKPMTKGSVLDALQRNTGKKGEKPGVLDDRMYARPSEQFGKKFYGAIDKKLQAWQNKGKKGNYKEDVAKDVRKLRSAIDSVVVNAKNKAEMNKQLQRFGLSDKDLYDARDYLTWLEKGGPTQTGDLQGFLNKAKTISQAQSNMNLLWSVGNSADMIRVYSHYLTQPGGVKTVFKGTLDALKAGKGNLFRRNSALEKQGVYGSQYIDQQGGNNNPFAWSVTAQKNLTYHLDKAAGGDGKTGIRNQLFDSTPWDRPRYDRDYDSDLKFGLARYPINEARWMIHTTKRALNGDKRAAANLVVYHVAKAAFIGVPSLIPAPVFMGLPDEYKEPVKELAKYGLISFVTGKGLEKLGINANIDLTTYTQPFGGSLGARAKSIGDTAVKGITYGAKSVGDLAQGKIAPAAINAVAAASAMNNFNGYTNAYKYGSVINSTTITKLLGKSAKSLEEEFGYDQTSREVLKAMFGDQNVKKFQESSGSGGRGRGARAARSR